MVLVQDDDVIQAFYRSDDSFGVGVLPRRSWRGQDFADLHGSQAVNLFGILEKCHTRLRPEPLHGERDANALFARIFENKRADRHILGPDTDGVHQCDRVIGRTAFDLVRHDLVQLNYPLPFKVSLSTTDGQPVMAATASAVADPNLNIIDFGMQRCARRHVMYWVPMPKASGRGSKPN